MDIQEFAKFGLKRDIPQLLPNYGYQLELGPGNSPCHADVSLEYPDWDADNDWIPFHDDTFDVIHAYHFLEHVKNPIRLFQEVSRILKPNGHMNIVVPHGKSELAIEDLDHKHFFHEHTLGKLFSNEGYDKHGHFSLTVHTSFILGVNYRNLCIFMQIINLK